MKFLTLCILLFISSISFSQDEEEWNKLLESAHHLGYCLYNLNHGFCNAHVKTQNRLVSEVPESEPEVTYFVMKEQWARERVTEWAKRVTGWDNGTQLDKNNLVLFFDINQMYIHSESLRYIRSDSSFFGISSFFIVNLQDDLKFKVNKRYKNLALGCTIYHNSEPNMLYNVLWREFMSGRLGLLEKKIEFGIASDSKIRKKFRIFKRRFKRFKKTKLHSNSE